MYSDKKKKKRGLNLFEIFLSGWQKTDIRSKSWLINYTRWWWNNTELLSKSRTRICPKHSCFYHMETLGFSENFPWLAIMLIKFNWNFGPVMLISTLPCVLQSWSWSWSDISLHINDDMMFFYTNCLTVLPWKWHRHPQKLWMTHSGLQRPEQHWLSKHTAKLCV